MSGSNSLVAPNRTGYVISMSRRQRVPDVKTLALQMKHIL
jgi:hypothetical protein